MKKTIQYIFIFLITIMIFGCSQTKADKNAEQIKKIKTGMTDKEVRAIMGKPDKIETQPLYNQEYNFLFVAPTGYSDNFRVFFTIKDSTVIRVGDGL